MQNNNQGQTRGWTLSTLATRLQREYQGRDLEIIGCNTLEQASTRELSFLAQPRYTKQLQKTRAAAVILRPELAHLYPEAILSPDPYLDFARAAQIFARPQGSFQGISQLSYIDPSASLEPGVTVYPFVYIGAKARIGQDSTLFSSVYVGEDCRIGSSCTIYPNASLMARTVLGNNVILHAGTVLGSDGFGFAQHEQGLEKIPQTGKVVVEDGVEIGANSSVDRATFGETRIGRGSKLDNQVQVGHNVHIGENCVLVAQVGVAGSTRLGNQVVLAGQVGVGGHLSVGDGCRVGAKSGVNKSLPAGSEVSGYPAMEHSKFLRLAVLKSRLPEMHAKIKKLESELKELHGLLNPGGDSEHE
ncbi:MAG: UDP-3-O-(3-hydroxymyristoyl)glucosamine N-acyltransferase [Desulfohalobiaceae bacterium]